MIHDDANDWFASQGQQIQDFEAPIPPEEEPVEEAEVIDEDRPYGDAPEVTSGDVANVNNMRAIQRPTAEVIVGTMDVVIPLLICLLIKGSDREEAKLTHEEHETLVEAWATYLGDKNVQLSPGTALFVAMITIYGSKVIGALTSRNERNIINQQRAEMELMREQNEQQEQQIAILKRKLEEERHGN